MMAEGEIELALEDQTPFSQISCFSCLETTYNGRRLVKLDSKKCIDDKIREKLERLFYVYELEYDINYEKLLAASAGLCQVCLRKLENTLDFIDLIVPSAEAFVKQSMLLKKPITKLALEEVKTKISLLKRKRDTNGIDKRFSALLLKKASELFNSNLYSDITILLKDGSHIYAHKVILATRSEYWKVEDFAGVQQLDFKDRNSNVVTAMVKWIYREEVDPNQNEEFLKSLYEMAAEFHLIPLKNQCEKAMMANVDITNCLRYYKISEELTADLLKQHCKDLMSNCQIKVSLVDKRSLEKKSELLINPNLQPQTSIQTPASMQLNYDVDADSKVDVQLVPFEEVSLETDLGEVHECQVCDNVFLLSKDLAEHMKNHANEESLEDFKNEPVKDEIKEVKTVKESKVAGKSTKKETFSKRGRRITTKVKDEPMVEDLISDDDAEEENLYNDDEDEDYNNDDSDDYEEEKPKRLASLRTSPRTSRNTRQTSRRQTKKKGSLSKSAKKTIRTPSKRKPPTVSPSTKKKKQEDAEDEEEENNEEEPLIKLEKADSDAPKKDLEELTEALEVLKDQLKVSIPENPDSKPYKCLVCEEEFIHKFEIQKHMKLHFGEKPFKCNLCESHFSTIFQLDVHIRSHAGEKPYKCDTCEKTFKNIFNLKKHSVLHKKRTKIQCEKCGKNYTSLKSLERHQIHHLDDKDKPHQCEICGKGFADPYYFKIHSRIHVGEKPYQCETCGKAFGHSSTYHKHIKIHEAKKNFYCEDCNEHFPSKLKLHVHLAEHSEESLLSCDLCGHTCLNKTALSSHLQRKHASVEEENRILKDVEDHVERFDGEPKAFKCKVCQKYFNSAYDVKVHMAVHSGIRPFKCDVCGYGFEKRSYLGVHKKKHRDEKPHQCDVCGEGFRTPYLLKIHSNKHLGPGARRKTSYKCKVCKESFITYKRLQTHIRMHADNQDYLNEEYLALNARNPKITPDYLKHYIESRIQKYTNVCHICGRSFGGNFYLKIHMRTHTKEKPYKCEICGKAFTSPASRRNHKLSHTGVKNFKCDLCGAAFYTNAILRKHLKTHSGERPFQCDTCGKAFKTKGTLRDHIKFHVGEKPFKCELCDKAFVLKTALTCHRRTHTGEKPFECRLCFKRFSDNRSKKKHESTHGNETYQLPQIPQQTMQQRPIITQQQHHQPQQLHVMEPHRVHQPIEVRAPPLPPTIPQMVHRTLQPLGPIHHHRLPVHVPNTQTTTFSVDGVEINQAVSFVQLNNYHQL